MARELLPDGLYLHLEEDEYFAQGRLGSTDLSKLFLQREGWWWQSHLNRDRVDEDPEAKDFGKALHKIVLEGDEAYERAFTIKPSKVDYPNLLITKDDIIEECGERDCPIPPSWDKTRVIKFALERHPDLCIWDEIEARWKAEREAEGDTRTAVSAIEDSQLRHMAGAVRNHPEVGLLFRFAVDHMPLAEVSVLWTDEWGVRRRARLDLLIPRVTIDVKTLLNVAAKPLQFAVGERVAREAYHVQMADHHEARKVAYRFIAEGKVGGANEGELTWLRRFPSEASHWDYVWLFYQKPDIRRGHAPVIFPWWEDRGDDLHRRGLRCAHEAIQTYRRCMAEFGPDKPWTRVEPLHVTTEGQRDRVYVPHWIGGDTPLPDEQERI